MGAQLPVTGFQLSVSGSRFSVVGFLAVFIAFALLLGCLQPYSGSATNKTIVPNKTEVTVPKTENKTQPVSPPTNVTQNVSPKKNETPDIQPKTPEIPKTNLSVGGLMAKELGNIDSPSGGPYAIVTYQWVSQELEADPTAIAINPTMDVLFDKKSEDNLVGFAFKVYTPTEGGTSFAKGFAVVMKNSALLDGFYTSGSSIDVDFNFPGLGKKLHGVKMKSKKAFLNDKDKLMIVYGFDAQSAE